MSESSGSSGSSGESTSRSLDRYVIERLLGVGASGRVYRALDPELERLVALKVLGQLDASRAEDPLREARLQARAEHPHIAQIFEVGVCQGRPAVAMQLVDGPTLAEAFDQLDHEQRLLLLQQVADAVDHAHRIGLIHRDLKPANVLVERRSGEAPQAVVVDFGIATEQAAEATRTGSVVGTPEYMAPEQLRGERSVATDIYALGVMVHKAATGRIPHQSSSQADLLVRRLSEPAASPRRWSRTISRDLEAVIGRCLAMDPGDRYRTAGELAADLEALRRGRPVRARPVSWVRRVASWGRRHRWGAAGLAVAATLTTTLAGVAWAERTRGQRRAEAAREFGQLAADLEWRVRVAEMSPSHDTSPMREEIAGSLVQLEERMTGLGSLARGPGLAALGRTHLALGEIDRAIEELSEAVAAGVTDEVTRAKLAQALSAEFGRQRTLAQALPAGVVRSERLAELEAELREPARVLLQSLQVRNRSDSGSTPWSDYSTALLEHLEGRDEQAMDTLRRISTRQPWLFEAHVLQAQIEMERARREEPSPDLVRQHLATADRRLEEALRIGASAEAVHVARCGLAIEELDLLRYAGSGDGTPSIEHARQRCDEAAVVVPGSSSVWLAWSAVELRAGLAANRAGDAVAAQQALREAVELAATARQIEASPTTLERLAIAHNELGAWQAENGAAAEESLQVAVEDLEWVVERAPTASRWTALGSSLASLGRFESRRGGPARAFLERAVGAHERAAQLAPDRPAVLLEQAIALQNLAVDQLDHGDEAEPTLRRSIAVTEQVLQLDPRSAYARYRRAIGLWYLGDALRLVGADAIEPLTEALEEAMRSLDEEADFAPAWLLQGNVAQLLALAQVEQGSSPEPALSNGLEALERARQINPSMVWTDLVAGQLLLERTRWLRGLDQGRDGEAVLAARRAREVIGRALEVVPSEPHAHADLGHSWLEEARLSAAPARRTLAVEEAMKAFSRASSIDAGCAPCLLGLGETLRLAASSLEGGGESLLLEASAVLERAWSEDRRSFDIALERVWVEVDRLGVAGAAGAPMELAAAHQWLERAQLLRPTDLRGQALELVLRIAEAVAAPLPPAASQITATSALAEGTEPGVEEARAALAEIVRSRPELRDELAGWLAGSAEPVH